ncbi:MAG: hypothetical protein ACT4O9_10755 [Blastocatellia bacterium]
MTENETTQQTSKWINGGAILNNQSIAVRIFFVCWLIFSLHFATNTVREIYPALSLGDHLSFDVSEYAGLHPDIFEMPGRGTFINNNPGASIMGAIPYAILRPVTNSIVERVKKSRLENPQEEPVKFDTIYPLAQEFFQKARERGFDVKFGLAAGITQTLVMAPVSALGVVVMFWILLSLTNNPRASLLLAFLYAFATPVLFRTGQLNQNMLVANFALFAFALLWRPRSKNASVKKPFYFLAGLCAGWTVVLDYSGLVAVIALSGYALSQWLAVPRAERKFNDLLRFAAGVAVCGFFLMAYQWACFGNPILPAQSYMPPANFTELGYRGFSFPQPDLLFETAFNIRYGLFISAPILLLALVVPIWLRRSSRFLEKRELAFVGAFTILFFAFCAANQYGRMQFNTGVRHIVPVVPFVFLLAANVLSYMPRMAAVLVGIAATYWSWCLAMYRDVEQGLGVLESIKHVTLEGFRLPWLTTLEKMGFVQDASAIPLLVLCGVVIWVIFVVGRKRSGQELI